MTESTDPDQGGYTYLDADRRAQRVTPATPHLDPSQDLLHPHEVARMFAVSVPTVNRWANLGKLPHLRTPGGHARFRRGDVEEVLRARTSARAKR